MDFSNDFIDPELIDLSFEISKRQSLDLNKIKKTVIEKNVSKFIVDISINGYSTKPEFDFECDGQNWSDVKDEFVKGQDAQKDPEALTVKRAIRVLAKTTSTYIKLNDCNTFLHKFNNNLPKEYAHLGGNYIVTEEYAQELYNLWIEFDRQKNTKTAESALKILKIRFPNSFL